MNVSYKVLKAGLKNTGFRDVMLYSQVEMFKSSEEPDASIFSFSVILVEFCFIYINIF